MIKKNKRNSGMTTTSKSAIANGSFTNASKRVLVTKKLSTIFKTLSRIS